MQAFQNRYWNSFAKKYDQFIAKYAQNTYNKSIALIKKELKNNDEVLEIGTGTGIISFAIATEVKRIIATDYAPAMIDIALKKQKRNNIQNIKFKLGSAKEIDSIEEVFDIVIASNVFHLIPKASEALLEIKRVMKSEGRVILPTYCHGQNIKSRMVSTFMSLSGFKAANKWSIASYRDFIKNEGFIIIKEIIIEDKIPLSFIIAKKEAKNG
ncbi:MULTISPECIES: class I SAM-dependent methyltransferase [unclassified Lentimicrobium]|uniref:class I SAM-dependent methyltransferase n=1 Tax=unclassified Lentimicrobium TaxID=2677434 RepID=UPI0015531109|nr:MULTISPECIES: class I SAM-dependent methyltransferase [unclassified Lentimicrobium]NPD47647.1 class I SAM-dependent methyltransferase [Lentimicrobium sp. S6]NPD86523.1 class I SAM-dependent methyltransferase [Lentimicrobium sp. L6]